MIAFGSETCRDFDRAVTKEWIEANGLGSYASSTIIGANTRRYHGLLVAALQPPTQRTVLLSKLEETLAVREVEFRLLDEALREAKYNQRKAAGLLGLTYHQFRGMYRKYREKVE